MITKKDIVEVSVDNKWFRAALNYALISWSSTFNRMGKPNPYTRMEKIILGLIAEKALEEYLISNKIKYETKGKTKWHEVDRYDIGIKEYAIDVKANFIDLNSTYIQNKLNNLFSDKHSWFLKCHALIPMDQFNPGTNERRAHKRDKVYVFPFIEGNFFEANDTPPLIHAFWDYRWLKKAEHKDLPHLGNLLIKYNGSLKKATITIHGTSDIKQACIEKIKLDSNSIITKNNFFQVFAIEWSGPKPDGVLELTSKVLKMKEKIRPTLSFNLEKTEVGYWPKENNWQSLALHNAKVHLLGWIYEEDIRLVGKEFKRFTKTIEQYSEIKVDNWGCLIKELEPMNKINTI
jgi:hypothetical protein